jgi:hypothetical protein
MRSIAIGFACSLCVFLFAKHVFDVEISLPTVLAVVIALIVSRVVEAVIE